MQETMQPKHAVLHFDGGDRGGTIGAGAAILVIKSGNEKPDRAYRLSEVFWEDFTSNSCEYTGLLLGLRKAVELNVTHLQIWGDSKLVVNQVNRVWRCNFPHLQVLRDEAIKLLKRFDQKEIKWLPREQNVEADRLCNQAMNQALRAIREAKTPALKA